MELLYFLEGLRTPLGDAFFSLVTHLGEETLFIVAGLLVFWCIDKWEGYYLLSVGLTGTVINQFLKLWFRIPRPWVKDPDFTIVESARAEATGYSFPSGHTQSAVGVFGSAARWNRQKAVRLICILLCVLVPLSRMYLGVHTPADVGVSVLVALALLFGIYPVIRKSVNDPKAMRLLLAGMVALAAGYLAFVTLYPFPADVEVTNLSHGTKNAYTMLGCTLGLLVASIVDQKWLHFDNKAPLLGQIGKLAVGAGLALAIKAVLKTPLLALFGGHTSATALRYFLVVVFAGVLWPLSFPLWAKLGKKKA